MSMHNKIEPKRGLKTFNFQRDKEKKSFGLFVKPKKKKKKLPHHALPIYPLSLPNDMPLATKDGGMNAF